ncbi:hypothetical protein Ocin01_05886 [Orchesella cincta]|uniref:DUF7064 domain-containing protein n=1 Tax=Orchesella cincta TaxID=48709 RepID=A0A1D2N695_ORCCI|nr:hypothetical protein Ocin01_05886 [Orchesella cincta]
MLCCCLSWLFYVGIFLLLGVLLSNKDPPKLAGVYSQPGKYYWPKVVLFYLLMKLRKWKDNRNTEAQKDHTKVETYNSGYGTKSKCSPAEMDKVQPLSDHFQAIDAIYFNGADSNGFCIITGTARRPHDVVNGFLILRIPELGYLVSPKFPDCQLFGGSDEYYGAEGFRYEPVVPMKHWKLQYNGQMKSSDDASKTFEVRLNADWKSDLEYFDYDTDVPPWTMARAIAKEPWSREYFQQLKEAHQTHYEQHGTISGEALIDGKVYKFSAPSMRDHSYGVKRNWKLLYRYMFHMFSLEDGRRFDVGNVCQPVTASHLELGYMYDFDGSLHALSWVDMPLYIYGEQGDPPKDYGFRVKATNGKTYYVQVKVLETLELNIGFEWEARIVERRCKFTIDGVEGYGISECMYRHPGGRPLEHSKSDPESIKTKKII